MYPWSLRVWRLGVAVLVAVGCSDGTGSAGDSGGVASAGKGVRSVGDCVTSYNEQTLGDRSWGFDGTVIGFENRGLAGFAPDRVATFDVHRLYRGGSGTRVVVRFSFPTENPESAEARDAKIGDRFLVAGGDAQHSLASYPNAWACGFTQAWSALVAQRWATVLAS